MNNQKTNMAYWLLKVTYGIVPIVAGLDKFFHYIVDWPMYLNPSITQLLHIDANMIMYAVGIIEIVAGIMVWVNTRFGASLVALWLLLIAATLFPMGKFYDIAIRDIVMAMGALALALLSDEQ